MDALYRSLGKFRLGAVVSGTSAPTVQTIAGTANIIKIELQTISGLASIQNTTLQTITGLSSIQNTTLQTMTWYSAN